MKNIHDVQSYKIRSGNIKNRTHPRTECIGASLKECQ